MQLSRKKFFEVISRAATGSAVVTAFGSLARAAAANQARPAAAPAAASSRKKTGTEIKGTTEAVVAFVAGTTMRSVPSEAIELGKRCLIDGIAVTLAGSTVHGSAIVREYIRTLGDKPEATVFGPEPMKAPAALAALANGASGHAMDFDDTQLSTTPDRTYGLLTHPTIPALSATLAVAERLGASGAEFVEAFLTGFEVECKIAEAIDPEHYTRGFHTSGTIGTFGAAVCAARLLKLDRTALAHMIAIASSLSAGIRVNFGSMTKPLHVARAAENGIFAAEMAAKGFTGGADGLDGQWGFFQVMGGGAEPDRLIGKLGQPYTIVDPGVSVKPYPSGVLSHPSMDAMLKVIAQHDILPEQIKAVRLKAGSNILQPLRYKTAKTELEAKFCVPFLLSSIILRRKAGIREFTDEFVASEPVQRMMDRVTTVFDPAIEAMGFEKIRSVVEVDLVDGRTFVQRSDEKYRGGPDHPLTRAELHERFNDCATLTLAPSQAAQALEQIESVEKLKSIRELTRTLTASSASRRTG